MRCSKMKKREETSMDYTSIRVKVDTYNKLKQLGKFGETYDELLNRLIETTKKREVSN